MLHRVFTRSYFRPITPIKRFRSFTKLYENSSASPGLIEELRNHLPHIISASTSSDVQRPAFVMELINKFVEQPKIHHPFVKVLFSKSHMQMYEIVLDTCVNLSEDRFKHVVGTSALTLIGPRGIGKTTTLKNMVHAVSLLYPQIIPIYVTYVDILANRYTQRTPILQIVADQLSTHGIKIEENQYDTFYPIRKALQESGKYVLLIVDEMDKLYEVQPKYDWSESLSVTLGQLAKLGDNDSGRFAVTLCGSSSRLMSLVTANGKNEPECVEQFPFVVYAPNLNGNKYRQRRIYAAPPTDLNTVAQLVSGTEVDESNIRNVRAITFISGAVAREVSRIKTASSFNEALFSQFEVESSEAAAHTLSKAGPIWREILDLLYKKNISLMKDLLNKDGSVNFEKVMTIDWEKKFQALDYSELSSSWKQKDPNGTNLAHWIYYLYDRNYITISGVSDGRPDKLYPYSLYMLVRHKMDEDVKARTRAFMSRLFSHPEFISFVKTLAVGAILRP